MTRPTNYGWRHVGKPGDEARARLQAVSARKNEWCQYRDNCLRLAANAERRIDELTAEETELVTALQGATEGKSGV